MYNKISACLLLVAIFLGCAFSNVDAQSTVSLHMFGTSTQWWVAVQPRGDNGQTAKVEVKDSSMSSYLALAANANWGYWSVSAPGNGFKVPLSFRLTSKSGAVINVQVATIQPDTLIDTKASYGGSASGSATGSSSTPTTKPQAAPTTRPSTPTTKPQQSTPTTKPSAPAPTQAATTPVNTNLCALTAVAAEPVKIMVPLYTYPGASWDTLIASASKVGILAIINPNSGPAASVDSSYSSYMTKLKNAGIEMVGYVYTSYGARDINAVKADIDTYASKYPLITGIFLDEGANDASKIPFYTQVYNYIKSKPGYKHVILNPGVQPDQGYLAISTNIMIYENYGSSLAGTSFGSWVTCAANLALKSGYKYRFSGIAHTVAAANQASYVKSLSNKGIGYVYVTDGAGGCCTYNSLTTYFSQLADAVAAVNRG